MSTADTHSWRDDAACRAADPALFFPTEREQHSHEPPWDPGPAKEVCRTCPVVEQCLAWALDHTKEHGVWGGTTDAERVRMRKARREQRKRTCVECGRRFETSSHLTILCSEKCTRARHVAKQRESRLRRAS